jgi:Pyruvate/2-oxoglutarate dehydrogenase complex, dihydrolipoamide dehydrogenase (E3) component, and related enzymes
LQKLAQEELSKELKLKFEILPEHYSVESDLVHLTYTEENVQKSLQVDYVLAATGRRTLLNTLGLERISQNLKI